MGRGLPRDPGAASLPAGPSAGPLVADAAVRIEDRGSARVDAGGSRLWPEVPGEGFGGAHVHEARIGGQIASTPVGSAIPLTSWMWPRSVR